MTHPNVTGGFAVFSPLGCCSITGGFGGTVGTLPRSPDQWLLYPGSNTIYLSDDQALDYCALLNIYNSTRNSTALSLATEINSKMNSDWVVY